MFRYCPINYITSISFVCNNINKDRNFNFFLLLVVVMKSNKQRFFHFLNSGFIIFDYHFLYILYLFTFTVLKEHSPPRQARNR